MKRDTYIVFIYSVIIVRNTQLTIRYMYHSLKNIIESKREKDREDKEIADISSTLSTSFLHYLYIIIININNRI